MTAITNVYNQVSTWTQKQIAAHPKVIPLLDNAYIATIVTGGFSYLNYVLGTSWIPTVKDTGLLATALFTLFLGRQNDFVITPDNILVQAEELKKTILKAKSLPTINSMQPRLAEFFAVLKNQGKLIPQARKEKAIHQLILVRDVLQQKRPVSVLSPTPRPMPLSVLWDRLNRETNSQLKGIKFFSVDKVPHRFPDDVFCPAATSIWAEGRPMHANRVGEGITNRMFIASQAPLVEDYERFWSAAFAHSATIIDLTTKEDETKGGVTKYYPDQLGKTVKYGSMLVTLDKMKNNLFLYKVKDTRIGVTRDILRYRYDSWMDFTAVNLPTLQQLVKKVKQLAPKDNKIVWLHCRAGIGRTGTLIAALILEEKIQSGEITKSNLEDQLVKLIVSLRKQRGPGFVQRKEQLDLLRQFAYSILG